MPNVYSRGGGGGDANTGAGYGTIRSPKLGAESEARGDWPYKRETELESLDDEDIDDDEEGIDKYKRSSQGVANDRLGQLNYHSQSFVNGSTRGLTGIMSGPDPRSILELFIREVVRSPIRQRGKPVGLGAPQIDPQTGSIRIRPGRTYGSKAGWFSSPPPKDDDPVIDEPAYSLRDIANNQENRAIMNKDVANKRIRVKNKQLSTDVMESLAYVMFRRAGLYSHDIF